MALHFCGSMEAVGLMLLLCLALLSGGSGAMGRPEAATARPMTAEPPHLILGDTVQIARRKASNFEEVPSEELLSKWPFQQRLPFLSDETTIVWSDGRPGLLGWPTYFVAVFTTNDRLVDWLLVANAQVKPLVNGAYVQRLAGLQKGSSVEEMYHRLGKVEADYQLAGDGRWKVSFHYWGFHGAQFRVVADAATGVIETVDDRTI